MACGLSVFSQFSPTARSTKELERQQVAANAGRGAFLSIPTNLWDTVVNRHPRRIYASGLFRRDASTNISIFINKLQQ